MSADTTPVSSARFTAALKDLSVEVLHLKVLEIRNSIAHLQYSNDQLKPFAEGTTAVLATTTTTTTETTSPAEPDQDCIDAIRENEQVIDRMAERIALIRIEVEERGVSWTEFQSKDEVEEAQRQRQQETTAPSAQAGGVENHTNGDAGRSQQQQSPWTDGTFQIGTIRNGQVNFDNPSAQSQGGTLNDDQLRRALEERMRDLSHNDGDSDDGGGMHL